MSGVMLNPCAAQQGKKSFTLEELIPGGKDFRNLYPRNVLALQWAGKQYVYFKDGKIIQGTPGKTLKEGVLLTVEDLNKILPADDRAQKMPGFQVIDKATGLMLMYGQKGEYLIDPYAKKLMAYYPYISGASEFDYSPHNNSAALVKNHNLYILKAGAKGEQDLIAVSKDGTDAVVYGEAAHQREFGIEKGTFWSPNGDKLAFYRMDQSMVAPYPLVDINQRKATEAPVRYPMAGMPSHHVTLGVYDLESGKTVYIKTGEPKEKYLTNISWSPDGKTIYIAEVNRAQNQCDVTAYDASSGARIKVLFTEKDDKYIEPTHPLVFVPGKKDQFIWESRIDGWNHLYLYNTDGKKLRQITKGAWEVTAFMGFDSKGQKIFFESTQASPLECHLYTSDLHGKKIKDLTPVKGYHRAQLSADAKYVIDIYQSTTIPRNTDIIAVDDVKVKINLLTAPNPDEGYNMPEISLGKLKANDGKTDLYYRLVKPVNFDPQKKYPTVVYVYGGPHAQLVHETWHGDARGWDIYMAQQGYVVFTLDNRGSSNRGAAFEQIVHRQLGKIEMQDQMTGVEFLKSLPYVDKDRMGVHGWSFGGFMTTNLMLTHSDVFKVGVAGGPVMDWSRYEIMYGERYMDMPQENPEGYEAANLTMRAKDLKGHLLLIHGDMDNVVVLQHSLLFLEACVNARTYPDYFIYPGHTHNVSGRDRVHLHEKITRYFNDYLK
ncbi:S9 family peptidase [Porphyromonas pogonae]|nr:S9 family peptidase [Porphyromonas pogonae]